MKINGLGNKMGEFLTQEEKEFFWGNGPWVSEPDYEEFEIDSLKCKIRRVGTRLDNNLKAYLIAIQNIKKEYPENILIQNMYHFGGHLCGYVQLPKNHPWENIDYETIPSEVHGGITFHKWKRDRVWIGFDCAHSDDIVPGQKNVDKFVEKLKSKIPNSPIWKKSYKTCEFVKEECTKLVAEIKKHSTTP